MDGEFDEYGEIAGYEIDETELGLNLVKIQLYFDSLNVKVFEESKTLTFEQLLAGIAGLLGCFLGFSIQTFGEYIEFFCITPLNKPSRFKHAALAAKAAARFRRKPQEHQAKTSSPLSTTAATVKHTSSISTAFSGTMRTTPAIKPKRNSKGPAAAAKKNRVGHSDVVLQG